LGGAKDFCPNFPKLAQKCCLPTFADRFFVGVTSRKWSSLVFLQTLGAIFALIFRNFAYIFKGFVRIFRDFAQNFKDFAQIFNKSKLLGVRLHPLHHWFILQSHLEMSF